MKKLFGIILTLCVFQFAFAGTNEMIANAFSTGNAAQLSSYFSKSIDLSVSGSEGMYSQAQSEQILKKFFVKNTPKKFNILHTGTSKNNTNYAIGNLLTNNGKFRVYLIYKQTKDSFEIQELSIQKDS